MLTRHSNCLAVLAVGACLFFAKGAIAAPLDDLSMLPTDQITAATGEFANMATPITPTEPEIPATGTGQTTTEDSPEPATLTLLGLGGFGAWWHMRRRKSA